MTDNTDAMAQQLKEPAPIPEIRAWAFLQDIDDTAIDDLLEIVRPYLQSQAALQTANQAKDVHQSEDEDEN